MQAQEKVMYEQLSSAQQDQVNDLIANEGYSAADAITMIKAASKDNDNNSQPRGEKPSTPSGMTVTKDEWESIQKVMVDVPFMDQIVALYMSYRKDMKGKGTELRGREYISTSKGHGIEVSFYDKNICIDKKKRKIE